MTAQLLQRGPGAVDARPPHKPTAPAGMPRSTTGPQPPQALGDGAGQTDARQGRGLLGETRAAGQSRSRSPGRAWMGKGLHPAASANLPPLSYQCMAVKFYHLAKDESG
jgi:hypothetical protein